MGAMSARAATLHRFNDEEPKKNEANYDDGVQGWPIMQHPARKI